VRKKGQQARITLNSSSEKFTPIIKKRKNKNTKKLRGTLQGTAATITSKECQQRQQQQHQQRVQQRRETSFETMPPDRPVSDMMPQAITTTATTKVTPI